MARTSKVLTAVKVANTADEARSLGRAADFYRSRLGEPGIDGELVAGVESALQEAEANAVDQANSVEAMLLLGPEGQADVADAVGKGRRSQATGPRSMKDAHYRLVALILGNPTQSDDKAKIYAGLDRYDGRTRDTEEARDSETVKISEQTEGSFAAMRLWDDAEWDDLEARLEARMTGAEVAVVASEGCSGCRRSKSYAEARGLDVKPCREHQKEVA
jgi:hypothetical protein